MMKLFPEYKNNTWFFIAVLLAVFAVSVWVRYQQFETWKQNPDAYFVGERPMMTTLDAPTWLRGAREYNDDEMYRQASIKLTYQNYKIPEYKQLGQEFLNGLSILDMLFNIGAVYTLHGLNADTSNGGYTKNAAKLFMYAAGVYTHLRNNVATRVGGALTSDLSQEGLQSK